MTCQLGIDSTQLLRLNFFGPKEGRKCPQMFIPLLLPRFGQVGKLAGNDVVDVSADSRQTLFKRGDFSISVQVLGVVLECLELLLAWSH